MCHWVQFLLTAAFLYYYPRSGLEVQDTRTLSNDLACVACALNYGRMRQMITEDMIPDGGDQGNPPGKPRLFHPVAPKYGN